MPLKDRNHSNEGVGDQVIQGSLGVKTHGKEEGYQQGGRWQQNFPMILNCFLEEGVVSLISLQPQKWN